MNHPPPPTITMREDRCRKDGLCVRLCPVRVFAAREGTVPSVNHTEEWVLCGQCISGCAGVGYPAVRLHSLPPREVAITWIGG